MSTTDVQTAIGRFVWHDHISGNPEGAQEFYTGLFGWTIQTWESGEMKYPMISSGGKQHGGFGPAPEGVPSHWLGHVLVEDADETASKAEAAGGRIVTPAMDIPEIGRMVVIADPQGGVVSAFASASPDEGSSAEGTFVWDELLTADVPGAKSFYNEIFGWDASDQDIGEAGTYTVFQRAGDISAAGCMAKPQDLPVPAAWITYIGVDDVDATAEKAASLGAVVQVPPMDIPNDIGRFAVIIDPTGAAVGLFKGNPTS